MKQRRIHSLCLLAFAPFAFISCTGSVTMTGRNPEELIGRSRSSIHAEFGKPVTIRKSLGGSPIDYIPVHGKWRCEYRAIDYGWYGILVAGPVEPLFLSQSIARLPSDQVDRHHLVLCYVRGHVVSARTAPPGQTEGLP